MISTFPLRHSLLLLVMGTLALGAFADDEAAVQTKPGDDAPLGVTQLEPGEEPRLLLRYTPRVGDVHDFRIRYQSSTHQVVEGREKQPPPRPILNFVLRMTVKSVGASADVITMNCACIEVNVDPSPSVPEEVARKASAALKSMVGWAAVMTINGRGEMTSLQADKLEKFSLLAMELHRAASMSLELLFPDLPVEAMGRGGRWVAASELESGEAVEIREDATYTVTDVTPALVTIDIAIEQQGGRQMADQASTKLNIESFSGEGEGEATIDLAIGVPRTFSITLTQVTDMVVVEGGFKVRETLTRSFSIERLDRPQVPARE